MRKLYQINTIQKDSEVFSIGYGTDGKDSYFFYYHDGYTLGKQSAKKSKIISTDDKEPCVYEVKRSGSIDKIYEIYVPLNTQIINYNIE